jgi:general stress protein 26
MRELKEIIEEYLTKTVHMSLATVSGGGKPWVCEVHFVHDRDLNLYFRSLQSRRHSQEIKLNPNVAGNVCAQYSLEEGCGGAIYFEGQAELISDSKTRKEVFPLFEKQLKSDVKILDDANSQEGHQFYKINISEWFAYGKFDDSGKSGKHSLKMN